MPRQRTPSTNSSCLTRITSPRMTRATCGHASRLTTTMIWGRPVPVMATMTAARMKLGMTWKNSETRITMMSSQPP